MTNEGAFAYTYSAAENQEVLNIRNKYLPRAETKLEELKRLDALVQTSGIVASLCVGIGSTLVFGLGMCLAMQVIGNGPLVMILGIVTGIVGAGGMLAAYPVYRRMLGRAKEKYVPRILELAAELSGE